MKHIIGFSICETAKVSFEDEGTFILGYPKNEYQDKCEDPMCKGLTGFILLDEAYLFIKEFRKENERIPFGVDSLNYHSNGSIIANNGR